MKRGQVQQIFIWIFVLILATSILFFGIKTVKKGEELKDEVLLVDFFKSLENKINNYYYLDVGSSGVEEFVLPSGVTNVCFIDEDSSTANEEYINSLKEFSNVFIRPETDFKENRAKIDNFFVDIDILCLPVAGGRLSIRLENKGLDGVGIS